MKISKKFMTTVTAITMVSALTPMTAFADTIIKNKSTTELDPVPSSAGMEIKYTYIDQTAPSYTVTIPAGAELSDSAPTNRYITTEVRNMEESGKRIVVTLDGASNDDDNDTTFHAKNGDSDATYTISAGSNDVKIGSTVAEFTENGSSTLTFSKINLPEEPIAGDYTETLTFGIALKDPVVYVSSITLNKTSLNTVLLSGITETLTATVSPDDAENKTVTWTSSDDTIATVSDGVVTPVAEGTAIITATANDGSGTSANFTININKAVTPGRGETNYLILPQASETNPVYFTGAYTGSVTSTSVPYIHQTAGSYDELYFNGSQIYRGDWNVGNALQITSGTGTESDPYVLERV